MRKIIRKNSDNIYFNYYNTKSFVRIYFKEIINLLSDKKFKTREILYIVILVSINFVMNLQFFGNAI